MFYCNNCGSITEGKEESEVMIPEAPGEQPAIRDYYTACAACGSSDIEDAIRCKVCGEYARDIYTDHCETCREEITNCLVWLLEQLQKVNPGAKRGDIVEAMAGAFDDFWDKYRFMEE